MASSSRPSKKVKREEMSKSEETIDSDCVETDSACYVLTCFPLILKYIFEHFPARRLNTCARVCKLWKKTADRVLKDRFPFYWDYLPRPTLDENSLTPQADEVFGLLCQLVKLLQNLPIQPKVVIIFYTVSLEERIDDYSIEGLPIEASDLETRLKRVLNPKVQFDASENGRRSSRARKPTFKLIEWFEKQMPPSCQVTAVTAYGVVGTNWNLTLTEETDNDLGFSFFCCSEEDEKLCLIPKQLDNKQTSSLVADWNAQAESTSNLFETNQEVKKIMYFTDQVDTTQELGFALYHEYNQSLIAGAIVNSLEFPSLLHDTEHKHDLPSVCCVAFCGVSVKVASVIIEESVYEAAEVENCIKKLKSHKLPENRSVAFMYACVGRGEMHYGAPNVESSIFRKHFPKTPILGLFGNGEIGFRYPEPVPVQLVKDTDDSEVHEFLKDSSNYRRRHPPKLYHAYTTIISLVSFQ